MIMLDDFVAGLCAYRATGVFNPWGENDPFHDADNQGAVIRCEQLSYYLRERIGRADTLLCAEAIGYQGGHFSGIPMTSERLLLGGLGHKGLAAQMVFKGIAPRRTSSLKVRAQGFTEPTATIVWGYFAQQGIDPYRVVLWNAFPWHPYHPDKGLLSNRTPDLRELTDGHRVLLQLLELGKFRQIVAVGEKAALQLTQLGIKATKVRHPANGGAGQFREQLRQTLR
jgi:hypothetical protein